MAGGLSRINIPPVEEPGKARSRWSGHDGQHVTIGELLAETRGALDRGDVKAAYGACTNAILFATRQGHGLGLPAESAEMKSLLECQFQLQSAVDDVKMLGFARTEKLVRADTFLAQAEAKAGYSAGGYAEMPAPVGPLAEVTTTSPNAPGYSATGGDHSHDAVVGAAIASIDEAIQQELAEDEDDNDAASLRVAKSALQQFLQTEHAESDDD